MCKTKHSSKRLQIGACSLLAKYTFSDVVGERASSLVTSFEQVIKPFLV